MFVIVVVGCKMQKSGFSIVFCFVVICICVKEVWNLTTAKWEEFYSHFPVFRTYERGKTVTFQYSPPSPRQEVLHNEASFYAFFLPPREGRSILLPNVILRGWSFYFLSHSWPVTRCESDMSLDPALTLHWQSKKCPPPAPTSGFGLWCRGTLVS